jgi:hypothetical protein
MNSKQIVNKKGNKMINTKEELLLVKKNDKEMDIVDYKIMSMVISKINNNLKLTEVKNKDWEIEITKEELLLYLELKDLNFTNFKNRISNLLKKQLEYTEDLETKKPKLEINSGLINFFVELERLSKKELIESYSDKILKEYNK